MMFGEEPRFEYFEYEQLTRDLCYNKPLSLHVRTVGRDSSFELRELVEVRSGKCFLTDYAALAHRHSNSTFRANLTNSSIALYYGRHLTQQTQPQPTEQQGGKEEKEQALREVQSEAGQKDQMVAYSRVYADRKFQKASAQFGVSGMRERGQFEGSVTAVLGERQNEYFLFAKALLRGERWRLGLLSVFDCTCRNLQTNNVVLELQPHPRHKFFARAEVDGLRNYSMKYGKIGNYFDILAVDYVGHPSDSLTFLAEYRYDCNTGRTKTIQSIIEKRFPSNTLKVGINQQADLTFQLSFPLAVGRASALHFGVQVADLRASRKISYGFRVNIDA